MKDTQIAKAEPDTPCRGSPEPIIQARFFARVRHTPTPRAPYPAGRAADNSQPTSRDVGSLVRLETSRDSAVSGLKHAADGFSKLPLTGSAVPVLYLDLGFLANLADGAIQFVQIVREIEGFGQTDSRRLHHLCP